MVAGVDTGRAMPYLALDASLGSIILAMHFSLLRHGLARPETSLPTRCTNASLGGTSAAMCGREPFWRTATASETTLVFVGRRCTRQRSVVQRGLWPTISLTTTSHLLQTGSRKVPTLASPAKSVVRVAASRHDWWSTTIPPGFKPQMPGDPFRPPPPVHSTTDDPSIPFLGHSARARMRRRSRVDQTRLATGLIPVSPFRSDLTRERQEPGHLTDVVASLNPPCTFGADSQWSMGC
jgi:hypothetical protein